MKVLETLLVPISADSVCGEDLSFSSEFDTIIALQQEDDPTLDQGAWVRPLKVADWPAVQQQCEDLLIHRSKDFRLAMWWAEARARSAGFPGLLEGLELAAQLSERFWASLYPQPENGDHAERVGNMDWFLQRIGLLSTLCPITQRRDGKNHGLQDLAQAKSLPSVASAPPDVLTLEQFTKALKETPGEFLHNTHDVLVQCLAVLARWQAWVEAQLGTQPGPNFVHAREALASACHEVRRLGKDVGLWHADQGALPAGAEELAPSRPLPSLSPAATGPIQSQEDALARLREVAEFFRRTQPHSPVAYLADKAARWGEMSLHDWLRAVVKDGSTLAGLQELLGVEPQENR